MPNRWVDHVKSFAAQNNLSYACALSTPDCKDSYRAKYGVTKKLTKKQNIEKMGAEDKDAPNIQLVIKEKKKPKRGPKELVIKEKKKRRPTLKLEEVMMEDEDNRSKMVATQEKKKKVLASLPKPKPVSEPAKEPASAKNKQNVGDLEPNEISKWLNDKLPRKSPYDNPNIYFSWEGRKDKFGNWFAYLNNAFGEIKLVRPNGKILDFDKDKNDLTKEENKFYEQVFNKMSKMRQNYKVKLRPIDRNSYSERDLFKYMDKLN
jgi:hypothetical protein